VKNDRLLDEDEEPNGSLLALPPQPPKVCEDLALPLLDVKKRAPDPPPNSDRPLDVRALCELPAEKARLKPPPNARLPPLYMLMSSPLLGADLINSPSPVLVFLFSFLLSTMHFIFSKHLRNILVFPEKLKWHTGSVRDGWVVAARLGDEPGCGAEAGRCCCCR
jgi:hypothetical protein